MSELSHEIGQRIRNYRTQKKLSQEELAEKCGLHPTYIGQVERGEKNATIESISKIACGLSVSLSTLFENIESSVISDKGCAAEAYKLIQSLPINTQEKVLEILRAILGLH
ncbi:MAG: helix-turn-helix domain-containing protein [Oscillospiraceae bacterium]|nr:helix-turn-helix domain-containing protein [Oscillospiraceae bacterium]